MEEKAADQHLQKGPSAKTIARLMTARSIEQAEFVTIAAIEDGTAALVEAGNLVERFHTMVRKKITADLDPWGAKAKVSLIRSFATGITKDKAAVSAAITEPWSTVRPKAQITKLTLVNRHMYG